MKEKLQSLKNLASRQYAKAGLVASGVMIASAAHATDPFDAAFSAAGAKVATYEGLAATLLIACLGALIGMKLVKKFLRGAT